MSNPVSVGTIPTQFKKVYATNATDASFPSRIPTITEPVNDGVLSVPSQLGAVGPTNLILIPFGVASDDHTADMRLIGWRSISQDSRTTLWVPVILGQWALTHCTAVGVANAAVIATERFCDTISRTTGIENVADQILSPTGNLIGHVLVDVKGFAKVEVTFDLGSGTNINALYSWM